MAIPISRFRRLRTAADPTGASPLWETPAGRATSRSSTPYGDVQVSYPANPNLSPAPSMPEQALPELPGTPEDELVSPDLQPEVPPDIPEEALTAVPQPPPANIIPFNQPSDADSAPNDWQAAQAARAAEVQDQMKRIAEVTAMAQAAINGEPMPDNGPKPGPSTPSALPPATRKSAFTPGVGFSKEPITFDGPDAWTSGDEVGFNSAAVEQQNPGWRGGSSWGSTSSLSGPYPTMGTPVRKGVPSQQTVNFYERAAMRGDNRRVNRFNARLVR